MLAGIVITLLFFWFCCPRVAKSMTFAEMIVPVSPFAQMPIRDTAVISRMLRGYDVVANRKIGKGKILEPAAAAEVKAVSTPLLTTNTFANEVIQVHDLGGDHSYLRSRDVLPSKLVDTEAVDVPPTGFDDEMPPPPGRRRYLKRSVPNEQKEQIEEVKAPWPPTFTTYYE